MDIKNAHRSTAYNLVRGKVRCERVFQLATARFQIPQRTSDQQKRVEGKDVGVWWCGKIWGGIVVSIFTKALIHLPQPSVMLVQCVSP